MAIELSLNTAKQAGSYLAQQSVKTAVIGATGAALGVGFRLITGSPALINSHQMISDAFVPVVLQGAAVAGNIMKNVIEKTDIDLGNWKGDRLNAITTVVSLILANQMTNVAYYSSLPLTNPQTLCVGVGAWLVGSTIFEEDVAAKKVKLSIG